MSIIKSFLRDESGSASPRQGLAWTWCICALLAFATLFGAYVQPAGADPAADTCTIKNCCGYRKIKITCSGGWCIDAWCQSNKPCKITVVCLWEGAEAEGP